MIQVFQSSSQQNHPGSTANVTSNFAGIDTERGIFYNKKYMYFSPLTTSFKVCAAFRKREKQCSFQTERKQLLLRSSSNVTGVLEVHRSALTVMSSSGKYGHF